MNSLNELISKIAQRAGELSTKTIKEIRTIHPDNLEGTISGTQWKSVSKSRLIEDIIVEEFSFEYDIEIERE